MNDERFPGAEQHRALQILDELSSDESLTQRDLSSRLGIALGLVNSYLKNLVAKGYVTVKSIPPRRYAYFLTPKGFAEKTRLTYDLLHDYTRIYREARGGFKRLFAGLMAEGAGTVVLAGADEVAEIAYLTLQEIGLGLSGVVDEELAGKKFFGWEVKPLKDVRSFAYDKVVVASYLKREKIYDQLLRYKVAEEDIKVVFGTS
ncbi:MAG: winged helix-turn-helix transcriptional regulator [Candidatus Sulfobium sp.]